MKRITLRVAFVDPDYQAGCMSCQEKKSRVCVTSGIYMIPFVFLCLCCYGRMMRLWGYGL